MKFLFPTVIHETKVPNFDQDTCVKIARQLKKEDSKGVIKSNITGWQSDFIYPNLNDYFTNVISNTLSNYFDGVAWQMATKTNLGLVVKAASDSRSIYAAVVNRSGGNVTYAATDDLHLRIGIVKD